MQKTMLAAVYHGPHDIRVEQHPVPEIGSGEALLKVVSTGICGTDLRIFHGEHRKYKQGISRIPGHEVVGDIVQVGDEVADLKVGQRVLVAPNIGCGHCRSCVSGNTNLCVNYQAPGITFDGSFAEFMRIPAAAILQGNLIPISNDIDPAQAALIEPFACVYRGQKVLQISPGELVLIVGAGPIGIMHLMLAKLRGAGKLIVSELVQERLQTAKRYGADRVVNPEYDDLVSVIEDESDGEGADVIIVAAPSRQAQELAIELAAVGGRINFFGGLPKNDSTINLDSNKVHYKELMVTGTTACSTSDCRAAVAIVNSGRIDLSPLIDARFPLKEALDAFATAEKGNSSKVIIEP